MTQHGQQEHRETREDTPLTNGAPNRDATDYTGIGPNRGATYRTPRWVKLFSIILIVTLVLLVLIQHLVFGGMGGHLR